MKHKTESKTPTLQVPYNFAGETEILGGLVIICVHMCVYIYIYLPSGKSLPSINHGPISNAAKERGQYIGTNTSANYQNKTKPRFQ